MMSQASLSLSLSLSLLLLLLLLLLLTKVTDAQYRKRFRASYNNHIYNCLTWLIAVIDAGSSTTLTGTSQSCDQPKRCLVIPLVSINSPNQDSLKGLRSTGMPLACLALKSTTTTSPWFRDITTSQSPSTNDYPWRITFRMWSRSLQRNWTPPSPWQAAVFNRCPGSLCIQHQTWSWIWQPRLEHEWPQFLRCCTLRAIQLKSCPADHENKPYSRPSLVSSFWPMQVCRALGSCRRLAQCVLIRKAYTRMPSSATSGSRNVMDIAWEAETIATDKSNILTPFQRWNKSSFNPIPTRGGGGAHCAPPGTLPQISQERLELRTWNFLTI